MATVHRWMCSDDPYDWALSFDTAEDLEYILKELAIVPDLTVAELLDMVDAGDTWAVDDSGDYVCVTDKFGLFRPDEVKPNLTGPAQEYVLAPINERAAANGVVQDYDEVSKIFNTYTAWLEEEDDSVV